MRVGGDATGAAIGAEVENGMNRVYRSPATARTNKKVAMAVAVRNNGYNQGVERGCFAIERGKANERGARTCGIVRTAATVAESVARLRAHSTHDLR